MSVPSRRVLLLSDTHGRLHPRILALALETSCVVHAGDIGDTAILELLADPGRDLVAVRGNNDAVHDELAALAPVAELALPGGTLVVEHGDRVNPAALRHELLRARHPHARLILYGHSHRQCIDDGARPWVANPGAAGRSRTHGGSGCLLLTATTRRWRLQAFQFPLADWNS